MERGDNRLMHLRVSGADLTQRRQGFLAIRRILVAQLRQPEARRLPLVDGILLDVTGCIEIGHGAMAVEERHQKCADDDSNQQPGYKACHGQTLALSAGEAFLLICSVVAGVPRKQGAGPLHAERRRTSFISTPPAA